MEGRLNDDFGMTNSGEPPPPHQISYVNLGDSFFSDALLPSRMSNQIQTEQVKPNGTSAEPRPCEGEIKEMRITTSSLIQLFLLVMTNQVHSHVDVYNFTDNTWGGRFDMPKEMAHSHLGMVTDGKYIYVVTGQYGPQCRGPTAHTFVLDTMTKQWRDMPPLPVPRYAPATQLWRGRFHVMGGSKEDRHEPALDHWSIAVKDGKVLEKEWRTEIPIPRGGPHRACVVVNDQLIVIGGQEGDYMAKPGSPIFKCSRRNEVVFDNVYMLDGGMKWKNLPSMPKPDSHIEFAWAIVNNSIVIAGGTTEKHPETKKMVLIGEVFQFNLDKLDSGMDGFTSHQGPDDPAPKKVLGDMYPTKLRL